MRMRLHLYLKVIIFCRDCRLGRIIILKKITFINESGGVGKTSCCFNTAWELALRGKKVLVIDMDGQKANISYFCGLEENGREYEERMTVYNVICMGTPAEDAIVSVSNNLSLMPANYFMATLPENARMKRFKDALDSVSENFDYAFIDVNPSPTRAHALALGVSDYAVVPILPDVKSIVGLYGVAESINDIRDEVNPSLKVLGVLINRNTNRSNVSKSSKGVASEFAKAMDTALFDSSIRESVRLQEVVKVHKGVTEYAPQEKVSADFRAFADELIRKAV